MENTPKVLVDVIQPFIQQIDDGYASNYHQVKIWLPFDTEESEFAYMCREHKYQYIVSKQDFFNWTPDSKNYNLILGSLPSLHKLDILKRCNELRKDWILLTDVGIINCMDINSYFADNSVQFIIPDKKISFDSKPSQFCFGYICHLQNLYHIQGPNKGCDGELIFVHAAHDNTGNNFVSSRTYK
jgi:hypothetical protein